MSIAHPEPVESVSSTLREDGAHEESELGNYAHASGKNNEYPLELARTKSIAETLSLPREIIFVAIVCSAQLLTRELFTHAQIHE